MHIVIIGNGISGITAARHIRKHSKHRITVISAETDYFFSRTALMYIYMGHLSYEHTKPYEDHFWKNNRIDLRNAYVSRILPKEKSLEFSSGERMAYDALVIATGSKPNKYGWPGQDLEGVQGLYSKQDLDLLEKHAPNKDVCKRAVIVGGGLIGIELAEMLRSREIPVTFLVRESSFWNGVLPSGESEMINQHIRQHHIDLQLSTNLVEILADEKGRAKGVLTDKGDTIPCDLVGLTAGVSPNIGFLEGSGIETAKGVLVNRHLETNIPGIYAIGDCAEQREPIGNRRPVEAVWYTGRMMGEALARTLCSQRTPYNPGHWFNSAKFLDIEYQTYGWVFSDRNKSETEHHFHWRHREKLICLTVAYGGPTGKFLGINTFGIRMRHEVFDTWLTENRTITEVIRDLPKAVFDPEFFRNYHPEIQKAFNSHQSIPA